MQWRQRSGRPVLTSSIGPSSSFFGAPRPDVVFLSAICLSPANPRHPRSDPFSVSMCISPSGAFYMRWRPHCRMIPFSLLGIIALIGILVNDGLVLISKFNSNLREGMTFDDAIFEAGRVRFRAIFLTSITTMAGLAPIILEKSFQAQLLKPMAISIAYGIGYATFLTLILLPILISITNTLKVKGIWLTTGKTLDKRDVESPVVELNRKK